MVRIFLLVLKDLSVLLSLKIKYQFKLYFGNKCKIVLRVSEFKLSLFFSNPSIDTERVDQEDIDEVNDKNNRYTIGVWYMIRITDTLSVCVFKVFTMAR